MRMPKKRTKERKRRQHMWITLGVTAVVLCIAATLMLRQQLSMKAYTDTDSADVDTTDDTISYNGKTYTYNKNIRNYVFIGVDTDTQVETTIGKANAGQADAIFVLSYDRETEQITVLSIPRDTMTDIEVFDQEGDSLGNTEDHISLSYAYGDGRAESCRLTSEAVSNLLYGLSIDGYCSISLEGLPSLMNVVGELTVTVPNDSLASVEPTWTSGAEITLTADNVERFVRYRDIETTQSALSRLERQQVFMEAWAQKAVKMYQSDSSTVADMYTAMSSYLVTDLSVDVFADIMEGFSQESGTTSITLPGEGVEGEDYDEYYADDSALYEMILTYYYEEVEQE